jgi:hypothetical protein
MTAGSARRKAGDAIVGMFTAEAATEREMRHGSTWAGKSLVGEADRHPDCTGYTELAAQLAEELRLYRTPASQSGPASSGLLHSAFAIPFMARRGRAGR